MFSINDTVMYGHTGVCKIVDICSKEFNGKNQKYYVLCPEFESKTTIYCPCDCEKIRMRKLLSPEEVNSLIQTMADEKTSWIENDQARKEKQLNIIRNGDHKELIQMIKTLYYKRKEKIAEGKKLHSTDEKAMEDAENLLYQEFAQVLDMKPEDVFTFITNKLHINEEKVNSNS